MDQAKKLLVIAFVGLLSLPLIGQILGDSSHEQMLGAERRLLSGAPSMPHSVPEWIELPRQVEAWYRDHFGFRYSLLAVAMNLKRRLGMNVDVNRMTGKQNWLFLSNSTGVDPWFLDHIRGARPFGKETLDEFVAGLNRLDSKLAARGIRMLLVIAPEKHSVYPENLPDRIRHVGPSRLDQVNAALSGEDFYVDAKHVLLQAKQRQPERLLYFEVNTHWNCWGAYLVYREMLRKGAEEQGWQAPAVPSHKVRYRRIPALGGWNRPLHSSDPAYECLLQPNPKIKMRVHRTGYDLPYINGERYVVEAAYPDQPILYMTWRARNRTGNSSLRTIVVRDSYTSYLVPYLNRSFSDLLYLHNGYVGQMRLGKRIEEFKPQILILEHAERALADPLANIIEPLESSLSNRSSPPGLLSTAAGF